MKEKYVVIVETIQIQTNQLQRTAPSIIAKKYSTIMKYAPVVHLYIAKYDVNTRAVKITC